MSRQIGLGMVMSVVALTVLSLPAQAVESPSVTDGLMNEARERIDATKSYTARQKEAFQRKAQAELTALQKQIEALQSRVGEASEATRADLQASLQELDKKRERAKHKMQELRSATDAKWGEVTSGVSQALDEVQAAYHKAVSYLR